MIVVSSGAGTAMLEAVRCDGEELRAIMFVAVQIG